MYYFGKFEENIDLSCIYLAVQKILWRLEVNIAGEYHNNKMFPL